MPHTQNNANTTRNENRVIELSTVSSPSNSDCGSDHIELSGDEERKGRIAKQDAEGGWDKKFKPLIKEKLDKLARKPTQPLFEEAQACVEEAQGHHDDLIEDSLSLQRDQDEEQQNEREACLGVWRRDLVFVACALRKQKEQELKQSQKKEKQFSCCSCISWSSFLGKKPLLDDDLDQNQNSTANYSLI